jgi:pilus assembly protein CpaF
VLSANSLDELLGLGTLTPQAAGFLEGAVAAGLNMIVAGGTPAGKTTLLDCLASTAPGTERVITPRGGLRARIAGVVADVAIEVAVVVRPAMR